MPTLAAESRRRTYAGTTNRPSTHTEARVKHMTSAESCPRSSRGYPLGGGQRTPSEYPLGARCWVCGCYRRLFFVPRRAILRTPMARRRTSADLSEFGKRVEAWRKKHGLSQAVVADLIGTHQRTYSDWLKKDGMPGAVIQIARLSRFMGMEVGDLVEGDASLALLADAELVRGLLARTISRGVAQRYVEEGVSAQDQPEGGGGA